MYKYRVYVWDEMEKQMLEETGLVSGESYSKAMSTLTDWYDAPNEPGSRIAWVKLEWLDEVLSFEDVMSMATEE